MFEDYYGTPVIYWKPTGDERVLVTLTFEHKSPWIIYSIQTIIP